MEVHWEQRRQDEISKLDADVGDADAAKRSGVLFGQLNPKNGHNKGVFSMIDIALIIVATINITFQIVAWRKWRNLYIKKRNIIFLINILLLFALIIRLFVLISISLEPLFPQAVVE
ncbi:hypothetical protein [Paenibacillus apis]|uniref:Uncharacterized protein n=1 Tax=Paenibacillus apis TaxID=1792174 RepID=A0A920CM72_9BACL|nr:hypothetical protein [Paenibacillus apis]GIO42313.1 hypothetical protein J41TS4_20710 [Paenibacillus apis]